MHWLFGARRLRERGILGINRRNAEFILDGNPRRAIGLADDKLRVHRLCATIGVPTPNLYTVVECLADVKRLAERIANHNEFVIKPCRGSGGRGVLVVADRNCVPTEDLSDHMTDILSGMFSLGGQPDVALIQQRVRLHPAFRRLSCGGIPDVRVILYRQDPVMAMLRLPTRQSNGRANLHQGGLGVGIDLASGRTHRAVHANRPIARHPDTGAKLHEGSIPMWDEMLTMSRRVAAAVGLGYAGVDLVLDPIRGPLLLEVNARPGLAIQHANGCGLLAAMRAVGKLDVNRAARSFGRKASRASRALGSYSSLRG